MANEFVIKNGLIIQGGGLQSQGDMSITGSLRVTGKITAEQFHTELVSSSIIFSSGSTKFGDTSDDKHMFTGSLYLNTQTAASTDTDKFVVLDTNGQLKYRTGAQVLSDIDAASSAIKNFVSFNNVIDFKAVADGYAPMSGITDIQTSINSPFSHWIAPSDGYIERIEVMVGDTNTVTDGLTIQAYKNGGSLGSSVGNTQGAVRTVTEYAFGPTYSFSKRDKIQFNMSKGSNTSDLYTFNVYFYVTN